MSALQNELKNEIKHNISKTRKINDLFASKFTYQAALFLCVFFFFFYQADPVEVYFRL